MKNLILIVICLFCISANAGFFIEESLYSPKSLLVGRGKTLEAARRDALAAMPKDNRGVHYEIDPDNSPANQCVEGAAPDQAMSCGSYAWQTTIPLVRVKR